MHFEYYVYVVYDAPVEGYIEYLLSRHDVVCIQMYPVAVRWVDGFTGEEQLYYPTLLVVYDDLTYEYVEVTTNRTPQTKFLYAQNMIDNWRLISNDELDALGIPHEDHIKW